MERAGARRRGRYRGRRRGGSGRASRKKYLSYFQGALKDWESPDQRLLRAIIPENRLRVYDVRQVIETIGGRRIGAGTASPFRPDDGDGADRIEGRPVGVVANNPMKLSGAIDSDGADKAARFITLCDAFDIPLLFLCDTPGIMVGPDIEKTALVRHSSRMFLAAAQRQVPYPHNHPAQSVRTGRNRNVGRRLRHRGILRIVANRRVRPNGAGGLGEARPTATNWQQSRIRRSAKSNSTKWSPNCIAAAKR